MKQYNRIASIGLLAVTASASFLSMGCHGPNYVDFFQLSASVEDQNGNPLSIEGAVFHLTFDPGPDATTKIDPGSLQSDDFGGFAYTFNGNQITAKGGVGDYTTAKNFKCLELTADLTDSNGNFYQGIYPVMGSLSCGYNSGMQAMTGSAQFIVMTSSATTTNPNTGGSSDPTGTSAMLNLFQRQRTSSPGSVYDRSTDRPDGPNGGGTKSSGAGSANG